MMKKSEIPTKQQSVTIATLQKRIIFIQHSFIEFIILNVTVCTIFAGLLWYPNI